MESLQRIPWVILVLLATPFLAPVRAVRFAWGSYRNAPGMPTRAARALAIAANGFSQGGALAVMFTGGGTILTVGILLSLPMAFIFGRAMLGLLLGLLVYALACGLLAAMLIVAACLVCARHGQRLWIDDQNFDSPFIEHNDSLNGADLPAAVLVGSMGTLAGLFWRPTENGSFWPMIISILVACGVTGGFACLTIARTRPSCSEWDDAGPSNGPFGSPCPVPAPRRPPFLMAHARPPLD